MKSVKNQFAPWPIVLLIGVAVLAISFAVRVASPAPSAAGELHNYPEQLILDPNVDTNANDSKNNETALVLRVESRQDYYDRRREYWEDRVDRRLELRDEYLDAETGDSKDADSKDSKDKKDSKAKDEKAEEDDAAESDLDKEEELIERRREYWRDRLDREW